MIKINLLPAHILERQRLRSVIILVVVVLLIEVAILGLVMTRVKQQLADSKTELEYWQGRAQAVGQFEKQIQTVNGQIGFYARWLVWKNSINQYHDAWAETLEEMAKWIYQKVQLDSMAPTPLQVQFQGRTDSLESFRRAYLNIMRCPMYANVSFNISGVPGGWGQGQAAGATGARRPGAGLAAAAGGARAGGGVQIRLGGRRAGGSFGAGPTPTRAAAPRVGGAAGLTAIAGLPIGVTFACILKNQYGKRLSPPMPPMGGGQVARGAGRPAAGARAGGLQIRMGGRR
jgi:hypothetical protein